MANWLDDVATTKASAKGQLAVVVAAKACLMPIWRLE